MRTRTIYLTGIIICFCVASFFQRGVNAQNIMSDDSLYSFLQEIPDEVFQELLYKRKIAESNRYKKTDQSRAEYTVRPGSKNNRIELEIANTSNEEIQNLYITLEESPRWLRIDFEGKAISRIEKAERINIQLNFDVEESIVSEQKGEIILALKSDNTEIRKVINIKSGSPETFKLFDNYPNPFNPTTNIRYNLPEKGTVKIEIFNVLGQKVVTLVDELQNAGSYTKTWDASNVASGMYLYRMSVSTKNGRQFVQNKKMLLIK